MMLTQNSNLVESFNVRNKEFYISKLPNLQKRLQIIIKELKMQLSYIIPSDFEEKYEQAKNYQLIDAYWIQNYKEIVAFIIEGQINTTLMGLSLKFRNQFGGQIMFWMDLICSFAQNQKYEDNLRIWHVIDDYKHCLYLQKGEYQKNRKFRRFAKNDIQVSKKLISSIYQLKNSVSVQNETNRKSVEDLLSKVETNYNQHEDSNRKIVDFLRSQQHKNINLDFFQPREPIFRQKKSQSSSYSSSRTKKTQREKDRQHNTLKQRMITDFSVNFREDKNSSLLRKIAGQNQNSEEQLKQKHDKVSQSFRNLSYNNQNMENLRQQFQDTKPKHLKKIQSSQSNIYISYSYLTYINFFIPSERQAQFQLSKPFEEYPDINYDNNDYEEYEQLQGEELLNEDSQDMTDDESLDPLQKQQMIEEFNPYEMDPEDLEVFHKAIRKDYLFFRKPWILDLTNQNPIQFIQNQNTPNKGIITSEMIQDFLDQSSALCPCPYDLPFKFKPIKIQDSLINQSQLTQNDTQILRKIVHQKSYDQVVKIIEEDQILSAQINRTKLNKFINKMTKKVKKRIDGKKINIYHVLTQGFKNQEKVPKIKVRKIKQKDESKSLTSQITSIDQVDFHKEKNQKIQKVKIIEKYESQNQKVSNKSKSVSESFSNKNPMRNTKRAKKEQQKSEARSDSTQNLSTRLRQRSLKPVYNIDSLLGLKSKRKQKKDNQEHQI